MESYNYGEKSKNLADEATQAVKRGISAVAEVSSDGAKPHTGEGTMTKQIESVTSQVPSATFLTAALGAIGGSLIFQLLGRKEESQFVGQWVPTILLLGLYNKMVKLHGSE